jgi:hypothetical protein
MARFRGQVIGRRGPGASRLGNDSLVTIANGWYLGIRVAAEDYRGQDIMEVWLTGGSSAQINPVYLGHARISPDGNPTWIPASGLEDRS